MQISFLPQDFSDLGKVSLVSVSVPFLYNRVTIFSYLIWHVVSLAALKMMARNDHIVIVLQV